MFRLGSEVVMAMTEERKKHMSEVMKAKWRERHAEND